MTVEDEPVEIYWCAQCFTPIIQTTNQVDKGVCPFCHQSTKYLTADLRPVFPEERLLIEIIFRKKPHEFKNCSVWAESNRYYIDGKPISISMRSFQDADADRVVSQLGIYSFDNDYSHFNEDIAHYLEAIA